MNLSEEQINIYKKLRELAEPHHAYTDQLMAMAIWIDTEYSNKNSVMSNIMSVTKERTLEVFGKWYFKNPKATLTKNQYGYAIRKFKASNAT